MLSVELVGCADVELSNFEFKGNNSTFKTQNSKFPNGTILN